MGARPTARKRTAKKRAPANAGARPLGNDLRASNDEELTKLLTATRYAALLLGTPYALRVVGAFDSEIFDESHLRKHGRWAPMEFRHRVYRDKTHVQGRALELANSILILSDAALGERAAHPSREAEAEKMLLEVYAYLRHAVVDLAIDPDAVRKRYEKPNAKLRLEVESLTRSLDDDRWLRHWDPTLGRIDWRAPKEVAVRILRLAGWSTKASYNAIFAGEQNEKTPSKKRRRPKADG